jgi:hypothetical protein
MKPLAGKRAFYSMGQRALHHCTYVRSKSWPEWAIQAYEQGYQHERWSKARQTVKTWPADKLVEGA